MYLAQPRLTLDSGASLSREAIYNIASLNCLVSCALVRSYAPLVGTPVLPSLVWAT